MTVDEVIRTLSALPDEQRAWPLVISAPPEGLAAEVRRITYQMPPAPTRAHFVPAPEDGEESLIAGGHVVLVTYSRKTPCSEETAPCKP